MREAPVRLRCEYLDDPLGIDTDRPRLSWWLNDPRPAELQTAYQVQVASAPAALDAGPPDLWDTGYVSSQQTVNVEYRGRTLSSGARAWWRVRCYDSDGIASPWSAPARFEVGLLEAGDWQAGWIATPLCGSPSTAAPAPVLYRDFDLSAAPASARLYLAVLGAAVAEINGRPVCDDEPVGPWSDLRRRVPYRVVDVTAHLHAGHNRLAAILGDGEYCGHLAGGSRQRYGQRPALCAQLVIQHSCGQRSVIGSDRAWRWYPSWILCSDRDRGEEVDARQYRPGWSLPDAATVGYPVVREHPGVARFAAAGTGAVASGRVEPLTAPHRRRGADGGTCLSFDFGRSVLGRVRVELEVLPDTTITVRYGDAVPVPEARGTPAMSSVKWSASTDRYTARGGGREVFEPRFALHAFRWVEIGIDREPYQVASATAVEVASAAPAVAAFQCDHRLVDALFAVTDRTLHLGLTLGPVQGLATSERRADMADGAAILAGAVACRDVTGLFQSWLEGLAALEDADGGVPRWLPEPAADAGEAADFGCLLRCLWRAYRCYGDRRLLERLFPSVQRNLAGMGERWQMRIRGGPGRPASPRQQLLATARYCEALSLASHVAGVLGRAADLERYETLARRVTGAFRGRFLTRDGLLVADDQLGYLLALELGLLQGEERATAIERLEAQLREAGFHPGVDLRNGALLLEVLTREGRADLAYQVLLQTTPPGWLHPLTGDASTLWDQRRGLTGRLAVACIAAWLQRSLLGLEPDDDLTPERNAYRRVRVCPRPPLGAGFAAGAPVREASGHLDTVHGRYQCGWRISGTTFTLSVRVPGNCSARVILPDGSERLVPAGAHEFMIDHERLGAQRAAAADDIPVLREVTPGG